MPLIKCKECGRDMSSSADRCPNCNRYHWTLGRKLRLVGLFLGVTFLIFSCAGISPLWCIVLMAVGGALLVAMLVTGTGSTGIYHIKKWIKNKLKQKKNE